MQAGPDHPKRLVSPSRGLPVDMHQVAPTSNRPFHCVNTSYLPDDSYSPAPAGPAKRKKKTSRVSPPAGPAHYNPLARWPSSCLTRQRDVTS